MPCTVTVSESELANLIINTAQQLIFSFDSETTKKHKVDLAVRLTELVDKLHDDNSNEED
jgi:hypothetical protein